MENSGTYNSKMLYVGFQLHLTALLSDAIFKTAYPHDVCWEILEIYLTNAGTLKNVLII